jgi:phosphoribosylanthranilate isomerase
MMISKNTKIKICGLTNYEDALFCAKNNIDYLGFIIETIYSKRSINLDDAINIIKKLKSNSRLECQFVAVVVDPNTELLSKIIDSECFDIVQFHGNESIELIKKYVGKIILWKAIDTQAADIVYAEMVGKFVQGLVIDSTSLEDKKNGKVIENNNIKYFDKIKYTGVKILAGGINPNNVKSKLQEFQPNVIDIASGVEKEIGKKDYEKIINIIHYTKVHE